MTVRRFAVLIFVGLAAVVALGIGLLAYGEELAGWFLVVVGCFFALANIALIWASKQHLVIDGDLEFTGRAIARVQPGGATWEPRQQAWAWIGGGNVPSGGFGRFSASMPLAVLEFRPTSLTLRFRPRLMTKGLFGIDSPTWARDEIESVYPVRGRWVPYNRGVAIATTTTRSYFWTFVPATILASLEVEGYPVSWEERYVRLWS
jgi:hypothetical protein